VRNSRSAGGSGSAGIQTCHVSYERALAITTAVRTLPVIMGDKRKYWFRAKKYGWGWVGPATWQGWLVFVGYLLLMAGAIPIALRLGVVWSLLLVHLASLLLLGVCLWKGEPAKWRWGGK